jgi:hypothetical protein
MLPQYSTATDSNHSAAPVSVFERAKVRLGIGNKGSASDQPSAASGPSSLLEKFHSLKGGEKTAFFRANKAALLAADAIAQGNIPRHSSRKQEHQPPAAQAREMPSSTDTAKALLEKFSAMTGPGKTAFWRAKKSLLKAAAAAVEIQEAAHASQLATNAAGDRAARNFAVAQSEALPWFSGEKLLERFHSLSGTAKTAYFRANHAALKIADAMARVN